MRQHRSVLPRATAVSCLLLMLLVAGCGFTVAPADLFVLHRFGQGRELTLIVSDGGTIRCNGVAAKPIPDATLIAARDLAVDIGKDATAHLQLAHRPGGIYTYSVRLQEGTVKFADTDGSARPELARAELFAAQTAAGPCAGH